VAQDVRRVEPSLDRGQAVPRRRGERGAHAILALVAQEADVGGRVVPGERREELLRPGLLLGELVGALVRDLLA
jgi:hypothetical protein